jgi:hypothetical protein
MRGGTTGEGTTGEGQWGEEDKEKICNKEKIGSSTGVWILNKQPISKARSEAISEQIRKSINTVPYPTYCFTFYSPYQISSRISDMISS